MKLLKLIGVTFGIILFLFCAIGCTNTDNKIAIGGCERYQIQKL